MISSLVHLEKCAQKHHSLAGTCKQHGRECQERCTSEPGHSTEAPCHFSYTFSFSIGVSSTRKMISCEILSFFVHIFATIIVRHREERPPVLHFTGVAVSARRNFLPTVN